MLGRTYHRRYGYPWRWALPAEVCWRLEHLPWRPSCWYRWRKACEHRGYAARATP